MLLQVVHIMCVVITSVLLNCWNVPGEDIIIGHGWEMLFLFRQSIYFYGAFCLEVYVLVWVSKQRTLVVVVGCCWTFCEVEVQKIDP
jgi:hypothetical protein